MNMKIRVFPRDCVVWARNAFGGETSTVAPLENGTMHPRDANGDVSGAIPFVRSYDAMTVRLFREEDAR